MIRTKRFKYTPKELFSILIIRYAKKQWWLLAWIWSLAIIMIAIGNKDSFSYFFIVFSIAYPLLLIIRFWRHVNSKNNRLLLADKFYEIDNEKIKGIIDEDTHSTIRLEHFIKVEFIRNTYLLFIAKNQCIYMSADSFENDDDRKWFESEIIRKIKK
jgi:hypothetical protein